MTFLCFNGPSIGHLQLGSRPLGVSPAKSNQRSKPFGREKAAQPLVYFKQLSLQMQRCRRFLGRSPVISMEAGVMFPICALVSKCLSNCYVSGAVVLDLGFPSKRPRLS